MRKKVVTIRLNKLIVEIIKLEAKKKNMTQSELMREIITDYTKINSGSTKKNEPQIND